MRVLITGFKPFNGQPVNPSEMLLMRVPDYFTNRPEVELTTDILPVSFSRSRFRLCELIDKTDPDLVILCGYAEVRSNLSLERIALNLNDASISDEDGEVPLNQTIAPDLPLALRSTIDIEDVVRLCEKDNILVEISNYAGAYVCNHVLFTALQKSEPDTRDYKACFLHIPVMPENVPEQGDYFLSGLKCIASIIESCRAQSGRGIIADLNDTISDENAP
jgi:pyroglutamyl-peptidase